MFLNWIVVKNALYQYPISIELPKLKNFDYSKIKWIYSDQNWYCSYF